MLARLSAWTAATLLAVTTATLLLAIQLTPWMPRNAIDRICYFSGSDLFAFNLLYGVVIGLPVALVMYRCRWTNPLAMLVAGVAIALPMTTLEHPHAALSGMAAAAVFWMTLKSCGALAVGERLARPRLSMALAGFALLMIALAVWANPICFTGD